MTMTDPIADMLTRVRNANQAYHDTAVMPHSKIKVGIAEILVNEGYIASYEVNDAARGRGRQDACRSRSSTARTGSARSPASGGSPSPVCGCTRSRPALPKVLGGLGIAIISTSQGLLTDKQAHRTGVGGEVVAYVW